MSTETFGEIYLIQNTKYRITLPTDGGRPDWYNYFLCGIKGVVDELLMPAVDNKDGDKKRKLRGMRVAVLGNIPAASGLSSSSALVSAAVLATSFVNEVICILMFQFGNFVTPQIYQCASVR